MTAWTASWQLHSSAMQGYLSFVQGNATPDTPVTQPQWKQFDSEQTVQYCTNLFATVTLQCALTDNTATDFSNTFASMDASTAPSATLKETTLDMQPLSKKSIS